MARYSLNLPTDVKHEAEVWAIRQGISAHHLSARRQWRIGGGSAQDEPKSAEIKALHTALVTRGHDVTRTPKAWMPLDASDAEQGK
jgi:hypothetical protein